MITLEPRAPWPWPYDVVPFYVQGLQPPVDPRFHVIGGFGLFGLTDDEKTKLAERIANAANGTSTEDVKTILQSIPTADDRTEIALLAVQQGGAADKIVPVVADVNNASVGVAPPGLSTKAKIGISVAIVAGIGLIGFGISRARRL